LPYHFTGIVSRSNEKNKDKNCKFFILQAGNFFVNGENNGGNQAQNVI